MGLLVCDQKSQSTEAGNEVFLPLPGSLLVQFAGRHIYTVTEVADERLTSTYWLSVPVDEGDAYAEHVSWKTHITHRIVW